jgi:hypothetical protein
MDRGRAAEQEELLRRGLRELSLGWILDQVDEALVNEAADNEEPPSPQRRLELIADAVAFAVEVSDAAEASLFPLHVGESAADEGMAALPADRLLRVDEIRFIDPVEREVTRAVTRDRGTRSQRARAVRAAAEGLKAEVRE